MTTRRNGLCPCGSGKKYKKCCLLKDQAERKAQLEARQLELAANNLERELIPRAATLNPRSDFEQEGIVSTSRAPLDPREEAIEARWDKFNELDFEGRIALFQATLEEPDLMDDEMAFGMLDLLYSDSVQQNQRDRFDGLLVSLHERLPDVYAESQKYYLGWQFSDAIAGHRFDAARLFAREMAELEDGDIDLFDCMLRQLAYHGQLSTLVEVMRIAWPRVRSTWSIVPWAIDEFARRLSDYVIFEHIERNPSLTADESSLTEEIRSYSDLDLDKLSQRLETLTGRAQGTWTMKDFQFKVASRRQREYRDDEPYVIANAATDNLTDLMLQFIAYLYREEGVALTKAEMVSDQIHEYILDRLCGRLRPRRSMLEQMMNPRSARQEPPPRRPDHALCPDRDTLDRFFADRLGVMAPQYHTVAATMKSVPAWLRFLESSALISPALRTTTLKDLEALRGELRKHWSELHEYPDLMESLEE